MRILILTQWFTPEPDFKGLPFARELVRLGHQVEVLTGFPNYPGGNLYPGYRIKFFQKEVIDGIQVIRVPLYPSHNNSAFRRILNYVSFAISAALLGPLLVRSADIVYVYHAPATVALPAIALKVFRRVPFVYDINDLWPDTLSATGMLNSSMLLKGVGLWCRMTYKFASHVVVVCPGFKRKILERGVPDKKISMIYNWCDDNGIVAMDRAVAEQYEPLMAGFFNVVFAGTMGKAQALDAVIDAAALLYERLPRVRFVFVGGGVDVERLKQKQERLGVHNILFMPRRPMTEISPVLSMADALLVHLKDDPLFEITVPSKTMAYLAVGRPVIMAVRGDAADLVKLADAGIVCAPENAESIAAAVEHLALMPDEELYKIGMNGKKFYQNELSLQSGAQKFERIFRSVTE